tara:strand:- start:46931 stop:47893 length:963 start_codon:yes stop_codon:yes gene_type:complete
MAELITLKEIKQAQLNSHSLIRKTPLIPFTNALEENTSNSLFLKLENLQVTNSYKPRAAFHVMDSLNSEQRAKGIVMTSSGNFAKAFALAATVYGVKVVVVLLDQTSRSKVDAIRKLGAEIVFCGTHYSSRKDKMFEVATKKNMIAIDTTEDRRVPIAHGSIGMEILDELEDVQTVLVPCSSGGLIAGIASAIKLQRPSIKVVGVQPNGAAAAYHSLLAGKPVNIDNWKSIADGLAATKPGNLPFVHIKERVDDIVLVSEEDIINSFSKLLKNSKILCEPAGAVSTAAFFANKLKNPGKTVSIVSGGNLTTELLLQLLSS